MSDAIEQYKTQLKQVEDALKSSCDPKEIESLTSLKADLEELIDLTKQTIEQDTDDSNSNATHSYNNTNCGSLDDEMAAFMSEIRSMESTTNSAPSLHGDNDDENYTLKLQTIKDELHAMVGNKCSAPHQHSWGGLAYHNAIICGVDNTRDYDLKDIKDFRLRILFTNPTHREMVPCGYFLDGNCRFDVDKCRFSHGELVPFGQLKEYQEPAFDKLKRNCIVLAKMNDKIWHKGRVLCVNFVEKSCRVRLENKKKDDDFNFEDLLPILSDNDDDDDESSGSSDSEEEADTKEDIVELKNAYLIEKALLTPALDQALGEWEKHTKGIGSKLMQKMGYIVGNGLGSKGEGIVVPISAQILPPGRSLDHCMELREAANGDKDLFSVERKLESQKKKQEAINAKNYERGKNKTDIFAFLNDNIFSATSEAKAESTSQRNLYKNHSTKKLNVESLKIAEDIRRKEREIQKLQESMRRHASGSDVHNKMKSQLSFKSHELNTLKKSEHHVAREQQSRRFSDKMTVF